MAQTSVDLTEEDAADLQFPKDWFSAVVQESQTPDDSCYTCANILKEPYIRCAECFGIDLCTNCFACGAECEPHRNNHSYTIIKNEFSLFEGSSWTAHEELELLDALLECGLGNWSDISRRVQTHSAQECEKHYVTFYIENPIPELPQFKEVAFSGVSTSMPVLDFKLNDSDEPPRYTPSSNSYRAMAGYNAARSDFETEFDNYAELDMCDLNLDFYVDKDDYQELGRALQIAVLQRYNEKLKERARRKKIIRRHGLIMMRKTLSWLQRYELTVTRSVAERLLPFMQVVSGEQFDFFLEGLHHAGELRQYIFRLLEFRANGLTNFHSCRLFMRLQRQREMLLKEHRVYMSNPAYCWRLLSDVVLTLPTLIAPSTGPPRRQAPPLDIMGLPGYERLTAAERQLCSTARLVPESYINFKRILSTEYKRTGGLKLAQARALIKIDVNKTRKLYDFLLQEGYIQQPSKTD